jgi:predicted lipid-binding transport protein (Tim44 family)
MSSQMIQLIVLAGVLLFLVLRIRDVLGTRDGFEPDDKQTPPARNGKRRFDVIEGGPDHDIVDFADANSPTGKALAAMKRAEPSFSVDEFIRGARAAHEMVLMAYEKGDLDNVRGFLAPDVLAAFEAGIDARADQGLTVEAKFIGLREAKLNEATYNPTSGHAELQLHFVAELTSIVRDRDGSVVEGDDTTIRREVSDWTFARIMGSDDPNWQLIATDE